MAGLTANWQITYPSYDHSPIVQNVCDNVANQNEAKKPDNKNRFAIVTEIEGFGEFGIIREIRGD